MYLFHLLDSGMRMYVQMKRRTVIPFFYSSADRNVQIFFTKYLTSNLRYGFQYVNYFGRIVHLVHRTLIM